MSLILIIEDDKGSLESYTLALETAGYHVVKAANGTEGLELAKRHRPDLIISDINLPGMDGWNLLKAIRTDEKLANVQFVLITGNLRDNHPRAGMERGADDFLHKPFNYDQLVGCVGARLERAQLINRAASKAADDIRSHLRSYLSHELFTPLAGILGLSEIVTETFRESPHEETEEMLEQICDSAHRLHRTLRNYFFVLELDQPAEGGPAMSTSETEVKESIRVAAELAMTRRHRDTDLRLVLEQVSACLSGSDLQLIVEELVDNACSFSDEGCPVEVRLETDGRLLIRDHGRGMDETQLRSIGMFRQFDRKEYEQQGLGLGCYLVQRLCERNGIGFNFESQPGEGTEVLLTLPLKDTESQKK